MFPYPRGQVSDSFANIGRICITQTCKLIYDIGHQGHRGMALQGKINYNHKIKLNCFMFTAHVTNSKYVNTKINNTHSSVLNVRKNCYLCINLHLYIDSMVIEYVHYSAIVISAIFYIA